MPQVAMAAGSIAGGAAGGLLKKALGGGGSDGPGYVPRLDPNPALALMTGAITSLTNYKQMGLGAYTDAIYSAKSQIKQANSMVVSQLQGLSESGFKSYNEYLKLIGEDPIQKTAGYGDRVGAIGFAGDTSTLSNMIEAANSAKDPAKRLEMRDLALQRIRETAIQDNRAADIKALGEAPTPVSFSQMPYTYVRDRKTGLIKETYDKPLAAQLVASSKAEYKARKDAYDQQVTAINRKWDLEIADKTQAKNDFANDFERNFATDYEHGYSADEINKKVQETEGFQVAFKQGQQAVGRIAAASGMLGTGNTLLAAQKAGQDLASNTYQTTLNTLLTAAQPGQAAQAAITDLTGQAGSVMSNLDLNLGQMVYNTMGDMGDASYNNLMSQADTYLKTAQQNMNNLLTYKMHEEDIKAAKAGAKTSSNAQIASAALGQQGANQRMGMQLGAQAAQGYGLMNGFGGGGGGYDPFYGSRNMNSGFRFGAY